MCRREPCSGDEGAEPPAPVLSLRPALYRDMMKPGKQVRALADDDWAHSQTRSL